MYSKMRDFFELSGESSTQPLLKAGEDAERMVEYRELGQEARQEFTHLVSDFSEALSAFKNKIGPVSG